MPERIRLEGTTLLIELDEIEAKIILRAHIFLFPWLASLISLGCRLLLRLAPLGRNKVQEMFTKMQQGQDTVSVLKDADIDVRALIDEDIHWPSDEEINKALGWMKEGDD